MAVIIRERFRAQGMGGNVTAQGAAQLAALHQALPGQVTMREVIKVVRRCAAFKCSLLDGALSLLAVKAPPGSAAASNILAALRSVPGWGQAQWPQPSSISVQQLPKQAGVRFALGAVSVSVPGACLANSRLWSRLPSSPPHNLVCALVHVALAVAAREPVLLVGPSGCKTLAVALYLQIVGRHQDLLTQHLTEGVLPLGGKAGSAGFYFWWAVLMLPGVRFC